MTQANAGGHLVPGSGHRPSRYRFGTIGSWLTIVGVVTFVGVRNWIDMHSAAVAQAADDVSMQMAARSAVGYRAVTGADAGRGPLGANLQQLTRRVISEARTPREKLCAVAVIGELEGGPAATDELDRLAPLLGSPELRVDAQSLRTIYTRGVDALSPQARQELPAHLGWFGQLALSFRLPAGEGPRKQIVSNGIRAFVAAMTLEFVLLMVLLAGIALLTLAIVRLIDRKLLLAYQPSPDLTGAFLEAFALYLAGYVGIGWLLHHFHSGRQLVNYGIELGWVGLACAWPLFRGVRWIELRGGLGWHRGRGFFREAAAGVLGYLAAMPLLALAIYTTVVLLKLSGDRAVHPIIFGGGNRGVAGVIGLYLLASAWAPLVEETMFRGALFHHLRGRHRWLFSAALSAIIFAALHPQGWAALPVLGAIGFSFAGLREWRGTFLASVTAHALNNAVAVTLLILVLG